MKLHHLNRRLVASLAAAGLTLVSFRADVSGQADQAAPAKPAKEQVQPMSRGPIHEGFAQPTRVMVR